MNRKRVFAALLAAGLLAGCQREGPAEEAALEPPPASAPAPGAEDRERVDARAVPRLSVTTVDGRPWDIAEHRGSWVVVNYWATWCAPCREEMPELSALASLREHVEVIGLAYEDAEPAAIRAFLEEYPVTYPIAIIGTVDPPADFEIPRGLPMTWLVGPDGRVAHRFLGPVSALEIEEAIAAAGGPAAADPQAMTGAPDS